MATSSSTPEQQKFFADEGYLQVDGLLSEEELGGLRSLYDDLLSGRISTEGHRYDLGSSEAPVRSDSENITQVWRLVVTQLLKCVRYFVVVSIIKRAVATRTNNGGVHLGYTLVADPQKISFN